MALYPKKIWKKRLKAFAVSEVLSILQQHFTDVSHTDWKKKWGEEQVLLTFRVSQHTKSQEPWKWRTNRENHRAEDKYLKQRHILIFKKATLM